MIRINSVNVFFVNMHVCFLFCQHFLHERKKIDDVGMS